MHCFFEEINKYKNTNKWCNKRNWHFWKFGDLFLFSEAKFSSNYVCSACLSVSSFCSILLGVCMWRWKYLKPRTTGKATYSLHSNYQNKQKIWYVLCKMRLFQLQNTHNRISNDTWDKTFLDLNSLISICTSVSSMCGGVLPEQMSLPVMVIMIEPWEHTTVIVSYLCPILFQAPSMLVGVLESPVPQILHSGVDKIAWHKHLFGQIAFDQLIHFFNSTYCLPGFENLVHLCTVVDNSKIKREHNYSTMMIHLINYSKFVKLQQWCGEVCNDIETCLQYSVDDKERHYIVLRFENIPLSVI